MEKVTDTKVIKLIQLKHFCPFYLLLYNEVRLYLDCL
jgi:hypothetical protein